MKRLYNFLIALLSMVVIATGVKGQYADFYMDYVSTCEPVYVTFYNLSDTSFITGTARFDWMIDGVPYTGYTPPDMEFTRGSHWVNLVLSDDLGYVDDYTIDNIQIFGSVKDFKVSSPEVCPGEPVNFWIEDEWWSVTWDFGDESFITWENTDGSPTHTYYDAGLYDVKLIVDNMCGTDTIVKQINVGGGAKPYIEAYSEQTTYCINDEVIFHANAEFISYLWNFGDGNTSTEKDPSHYYDTQVPRNYTVTLTATNSCGGSNTDTIEVGFTTDKPADAYFDYSFEGYMMAPCPNTPVRFNAMVSGTYGWDFGDGSISNERYPKNIYSIPGDYYVSLTVTNGCGNSAVYSEWITVMFNPSDLPVINFHFDVPELDWEQMLSIDTLQVCPGELVNLQNDTYSMYGGELEYNWDFGDGNTSNVKNISHVYSGPGLYTITLSGTSFCGGTSSLSKWVLVESTIQPEASLGVLPEVICDGEQVFFYDNMYDEKLSYTYDIDFGDGAIENNITIPGDSLLYTLRNHTYTGTPGTEFNYIFTVTNKCGNSLTKNGTITITDDPLHKPFYYVENTTQTEQDKAPEDWSKRMDPTDHRILLSLSWPIWQTGMDTNFFVYFWYGGFDPEGEDTGQPNGFVKFTSSKMVIGDTVSVYIPLDPIQPPYVGMAAGWNCTGTEDLGKEPDAWGMPTCGGTPVTGINIVPFGYSDLLDVACDGIVIDPAWEFICNTEKPMNRYFYEINPGSFVQLELWGDNTYELYGTSDAEGYNYLVTFSSGTYEIGAENAITFYDSWICFNDGYYSYTLSTNTDTLNLYLSIDTCSDRLMYLTMKPFIRKPDYGQVMDLSACPGDDVLFKIAGGVSYEWNFGDGYQSNMQFPKHAYSEPGIYNAFVVATNACGRKDTIWTKVNIVDNNLPDANFWMDNYDVPRYEPIQFFSEDRWLDQAGNYTYLWDFGDGNTSTAENPVHAYDRNGDYPVTLTVTNGCGTTTQTQHLYIREAVAACQAKFDFSIGGDTVNLTDLSWGNPTSWFWDFGDGFNSDLQNPSHIYDYDGIYFVCLSIFDENSACATQVCREVPVGVVGCRADYKFTVNEATNSVIFTDASTNAQEWYWDFGDGTFSSDQNPEHTYSVPGMYYVYMATYDYSTDCFAEVIKEMRVGSAQADICYADFSFFVDAINQTVVFTDESSTNVTEWYWTFGDGTFIAERNPEHIYPREGFYNVSLIVFDQYSGCNAQISKEIPVGISECNLKADFGYFIDISTDSIAFSDKSTGDITNWFWNFGDGMTSSQRDPRHVYTQPGFYLVTLSVFNDNNYCTDYVAEFIQIGSVDCHASFKYTVDPTSNTVSFVNESKGDISYYFWFFGDGSFSIEESPVYNYSWPGLYFVELTIMDASGLCMDYYSEPIQVGTLSCRANFTYFIDSLSNAAYFTPDAIGDITDYLWFFGDGFVSTLPNPMHVFTQPGYFTVGLNTFDQNSGCMDYYEEVILIGNQGVDCRADFMYIADPETYNVKFTDNSKGNIVYYVWDFGDGQISLDQNPEHDYANGGYYFVCLTVVNSFDISNTVCNIIQVAPDASKDCLSKFIYTVDSVTMNVRFIDKSFGTPDGWFWNFDDGSISTENNPTHTYGQPGYYLVNLSIANATTNCTSNHAELINVGMENAGLKTDYLYDIDTISLKADSYPVDFIGVTLGDGNKLKWSFGDGTYDTTSLQPTHTYTTPGVYIACLTISNQVTGDETTKCDTLYIAISGIDQSSAIGTRLSNYPNPFKDYTNIVYQLAENSEIDLSIFDNAGRKVETIESGYRNAGTHVIEYNGSRLDSGIYHLRLITRNQIITNMMIVR